MWGKVVRKCSANKSGTIRTNRGITEREHRLHNEIPIPNISDTGHWQTCTGKNKSGKFKFVRFRKICNDGSGVINALFNYFSGTFYPQVLVALSSLLKVQITLTAIFFSTA